MTIKDQKQGTANKLSRVLINVVVVMNGRTNDVYNVVICIAR